MSSDQRQELSFLKELLKQKDIDKQQLKASYDEALQALADSEAKRETAERELKIAQDQMATMWKELEDLHQRLNGSSSSNTLQVKSSPPPSPPTSGIVETDGPIELCCTLCKEKIRSQSPLPPTPFNSPAHSKANSPKHSRFWPFGGNSRSSGKTRVTELDQHSKVCSSQLKPASTPSPSSSPRLQRKARTKGPTTPTPLVQSSEKQRNTTSLRVNVTRTPTAATDLAPFKVVTWTSNMPQFSSESYEVFRSAGDFQWIHDVLQDSCPERIVPPLRTTISLDATVSEYQRFLSRLVVHKTLRTEQPFIVFLTGSIEELRVLRAKFRPRLPSEEPYRPTQGRDTSSGALVATKDYLSSLECNILGLVNHLQSRTSDTVQREDSLSHWFRHIAEGEPCDTYLRVASGDLARTCQVIESHKSTFDGDDALCVQNLQSIADYIHSAVDLLARVEQAVDRFLYWDEEVMLYEAVTSSPSCDTVAATSSSTEEVFDDSGVSSISGSSVNSSNHPQEDESPIRRIGGGGGDDSISEKWALASSNCSDAKEYLEMICCDLSEELSQFDLRKEQELRQVFLDLAAGQMEKNEKLQGKWYAMRCLLDTPIKQSLRAVQFVSNNDRNSPAALEDQTKKK